MYPVSIYYLVARNTIDEIVWEKLKKKLEVVGEAVDGKVEKMKTNEIEAEAPPPEVMEDTFLSEIMESVELFVQVSEIFIFCVTFLSDFHQKEGKEKRETHRKILLRSVTMLRMTKPSHNHHQKCLASPKLLRLKRTDHLVNLLNCLRNPKLLLPRE